MSARLVRIGLAGWSVVQSHTATEARAPKHQQVRPRILAERPKKICLDLMLRNTDVSHYYAVPFRAIRMHVTRFPRGVRSRLKMIIRVVGLVPRVLLLRDAVIQNTALFLQFSGFRGARDAAVRG